MPYYGYDEQQFFACDGAPAEVAAQRRAGFARLAAELRSRAPASIAFSDSLASGLSDVQFTDAYRVPFQFRDYVRERLRVGSVVDESRGTELRDLDRRWSYDVSRLVRREPVRLRLLQGVHCSRRAGASRSSAPCSGRSIPSCATTSSA